MRKKILGLDLGSNSVGWALLEEEGGEPRQIIALGSRIFNKAVEEKSPTPKNQSRRQQRLGRRVLQRRARRRQRMLNYLVSLDLLPKELKDNSQPESILNDLGDPYQLRDKALDEKLSPHEFGRVLLHFAARRGFLSSKKQAAGDLIDDPDTREYLAAVEEEETVKLMAKGNKPKVDDQSESAFKTDIAEVAKAIKAASARTLGEYLYRLEKGECKRNRTHAGGHLRTDRKMYKEELAQIWEKQKQHFPDLPDDFMADNKGVKAIIFYQRPLKLKKDRVSRCSLEPKNYRASMARLEVQRFRYLLDVNHLGYIDTDSGEEIAPSEAQKAKLILHLETHPNITLAAIKKELGLGKFIKLNLEAKNIKGNVTACEIRGVIGKQWDEMGGDQQKSLFEDLFSIKKKSALKNRLIKHWNFDKSTAIKLCLLEFEDGHSNHSLKAINKMLPHLENGKIYSDARMEAGYDYEPEEIDVQEKLPAPPETTNPIVNKGLHELKRVVNAVIKQYGKPDAVRIEMARDLEMNTERVKDFIKRQKEYGKANEDAQEAFKAETGWQYASRNDKIKYRLWKEQKEQCVYSGRFIIMAQLFTSAVEIDHIVPRSRCLDDSYMNKVVCFTEENREKRGNTPISIWESNDKKWEKITSIIDKIYEDRRKKYRKYVTHPKKKRFYMRVEDIPNDMSAAQLNDTRYISKVAQGYVKQLGCDVSATKGAIVSELRYLWGLNSLLGDTDTKTRDDHRHHSIDAVAIACINRGFHTKLTHFIKEKEENMRRDIEFDLPYKQFKTELREKLENMIVAHVPQRKITGALHEDTGAGYVAKHGGLVYRKPLNGELNVEKIVDPVVKDIVKQHISKYKNQKEAFADGNTVYHKDGKTPIKRVRVLQSPVRVTKKQNAEEVLAKTKFPVKNKLGEIFKWMVYGNTHHVEIIRHKETGKINGEFVTMMEAHRRAMTGTKSARKHSVVREEIVKKEHGEEYEFLMALHINDTVSVESKSGGLKYYRVQKMGVVSRTITLRMSTATTQDNKDEEIIMRVNKTNFEKYKIHLHHINAIGQLIDD